MHELIQMQRVNNVARHLQPRPTQSSGFLDQFLIRASREVYTPSAPTVRNMKARGKREARRPWLFIQSATRP